MSTLSNIGRQMCKAGLIGVPLLMLVGLLLFVSWTAVSLVSGDTVDWSLVVWMWGALFFLSAILGMFGGHWNRRIANWWNGRGQASSQLSFILTMSIALPLPAFIVMITRMRSDGVPGWLWALAGIAVVLGVVTAFDRHRLFGRGGTTEGV